MLQELGRLDTDVDPLRAFWQDPRIETELREWHNCGKSVRWFCRVLLSAIARMEQDDLTYEDLVRAIGSVEPNSEILLVQSITVRELALLIGMRRLEKKEQQVYTFEMVYEQLQHFKREKSTTLRLSRADSLVAFQHLIELNLTRRVRHAWGTRVGNQDQWPVEYEAVQMVIEPTHLDQIIESGQVHCPTFLQEWALKP